jgi:homopolymeric O-antigen transport system ATP-binding protein
VWRGRPFDKLRAGSRPRSAGSLSASYQAMSDIVIRVEGLGKRYRIGERERYLALRDVLTRAITAPVRLFGPGKSASSSNGNGNSNGHGDPSHIWALKDVSFYVHQGEVVGIIGSNGAGKSTLLKILARVTKPTRGFAEIRGRMGTLLEVGTGFHPELTGRENVFLSGAILGMGKSEIRRKFDEIVAFAEVEKFIDTPLKHYSSGMQMRLAFAVAANLEPEILLVDEVLAVGDLQFQRKCLGKMGDVAKTGRTILFVSHQMNQIRRLCDRSIWVDGGRLREDGSAKEVVNRYELASLKMERCEVEQMPGIIAFRPWVIGNTQSNRLDLDQHQGRFVVGFRSIVKRSIERATLIILLQDRENLVIWSAMYSDLRLTAGALEMNLSFDTLPLNPGIYSWEIRVFDGHHWSEHQQVPEFSVISKRDADVFGNLKGALNLDVSFDLSRNAEYELGKR